MIHREKAVRAIDAGVSDLVDLLEHADADIRELSARCEEYETEVEDLRDEVERLTAEVRRLGG